MKKVLLTFGGKEFSQGAFNFAKQLHEQEPIFLTAIFLPDLVYANLWSDGSGVVIPTYFPKIEEQDQRVQENMDHFTELCRDNGIGCRLHHDYYGLPQDEIIKETRFADVLIISSETFYKSFAENDLSSNLRDVLHGSECPVIVVPEQFHFPTKNILFYDGSASSVFAIKQFYALFPELCRQETVLVYSKDDTDETLPHESFIQELASLHFQKLEFSKLHFTDNKAITDWIQSKEGVMLVGGAFGRSGFSEIFRKSFMQDIITLHKFPVFIAHR